MLEAVKSGIKGKIKQPDHLSIDESMIPFKGRHKYKQYLPLKANKLGFKVFLLCESITGYVCDFLMYKEINNCKPYNVVQHLVKSSNISNTHITFDN
jgi:hypothetical protein